MRAPHCEEIEEVLKKHSLSFSPAAAVWTDGSRMVDNHTHVANHRETIPGADYVAFFCQYLGYTDDPVLAAIAHEHCRCRYFHVSDHMTIQSELEATQDICQGAGYFTNIKKVLTSEGNRHADLGNPHHSRGAADRPVGGRYPAPRFHRRWSKWGAQPWPGMLRNPHWPDQVCVYYCRCSSHLKITSASCRLPILSLSLRVKKESVMLQRERERERER